jgi:hypothetical protein
MKYQHSETTTNIMKIIVRMYSVSGRKRESGTFYTRHNHPVHPPATTAVKMADLSSAPPVAAPAIPVLVFTGFLGAGKTTIILNLIRQIPHLKSAWLKNGTSQHRLRLSTGVTPC